MKDLRARKSYSGWEEGFGGVRHVIEGFLAENPGTVYAIHVDKDNRFQHVTLVPAQSWEIVCNSGRTYFGLDACFTRKETWEGQILMLSLTDGNNTNMPIAIGIFNGRGAESGDNYTTFITLIMSLGDGALGLWLNREDVVVNTDRHLSFSPAIDKCLPRVQHRYDVRHIIANMHDHGLKNVLGHMFNCHKAIDRGEFDTARKGHSISRELGNVV
jgi:hypothetical protein